MKTFDKTITPTNKRNNCLCDGKACYYHVDKDAWFDKLTNEQIEPETWSYAILPFTMTATLENFLLTLIQFGENTARQDFAQLSPEKQVDVHDELRLTIKTIKDNYEKPK